MALESEEDKCMYAFGAALATQTDQFKKVTHLPCCVRCEMQGVGANEGRGGAAARTRMS